MPRFSVVVPTRNRCRTLPFTLQTVLHQDFDDFELIVCDNCSGDDTGSVVSGLRDSRLKYVRSDIPLAMSDNWEKAVEQASGEFLIVIGDDDGLMPSALTNIDAILRSSGMNALHWQRVNYNWPDFPIPELINQLVIPLDSPNQIVDGRKQLQRVGRVPGAYVGLPMLYNSAISRQLTEEMKRRSGRVFKASSPDVYSGMSLAWLAGRYASSGQPFSINGGSGTSNGVGTTMLNNTSGTAQEFRALTQKAAMPIRADVPDVPTLPSAVADSYFRAKQEYFQHEARLAVDRRRLAQDCLKSLRDQQPEQFRQSVKAIRESLADVPNVQRWFDRRYWNQVDKLRSATSDWSWQKGFRYGALHLDAADFGITDVFAAAQYCGKFFPEMAPQFQVHSVPYSLRIRKAVRSLMGG